MKYNNEDDVMNMVLYYDRDIMSITNYMLEVIFLILNNILTSDKIIFVGMLQFNLVFQDINFSSGISPRL